MTIASELEVTKTYLENAYDAIEGKGGTIPTNKNMANLPDAIASLGNADPYVVPYFDGGEYGAIAYLDDNNEIQYYVAQTETDIDMVGSGTIAYTSVLVTLPNGYKIKRGRVLAYSFGSEIYNTSVGNNFFYYMTQLRCIYGMENKQWTSIGASFLRDCWIFNQPITLPNNLTSIGANFLYNANSFNQPITLPNNLTSIGASFLSSSAFNQPITLPNSLTSIGDGFLSSSAFFNQPITLPNNLTSIGANFLTNTYSFNQPITIPASVTSIDKSFLSGCSAFNQPITLPNNLTSIGANFLYNANSFNQPITIPASVTSIGSAFFRNANSFIGPLNVYSAAAPTDNQSLSTTASSTAIYATGVTITGPQASAWKTALPNRTTTPFRKLK